MDNIRCKIKLRNVYVLGRDEIKGCLLEVRDGIATVLVDEYEASSTFPIAQITDIGEHVDE